MAILTPEELLSAIETHLLVTRQTASAFGLAINNDPALVLELRRGRCPSLSLANRILARIGNQAKEDA
jgi:hypothetical protein